MSVAMFHLICVFCLPAESEDRWVKQLDANANTKARISMVRTALNACRGEIRSLRCGIEFEKLQPARENLKKFDIHYFGELSWRRDTVRYVLWKKDEPDYIEMAVLRTPEGLTHFHRMGIAKKVEILPARGTVNAVEKGSEVFLSDIDPLIHYGGFVDTWWENSSKYTKASSTEADGNLEITLEGGSEFVIKARFDKGFDYLPVEVKIYRNKKDGTQTNPLTCVMSWSRVHGKIVPTLFERRNVMICQDAKLGTITTRVRFTNIEVNIPIPEERWSADSLPIPEGTGGADLRTRPGKPLLFSKGKLSIVDRKKSPAASPEAVATPVTSDQLANEYEHAANLRTFYYRNRIAWISGIIAATLGCGLIAYKMYKRGWQ